MISLFFDVYIAEWDTTLCPDGDTCATNCALDGANYSGTYGISSSGDELSLQFVTGANIGSRVYLLEDDDTTYKKFNLLNKEFTFDIDMSTLPVCSSFQLFGNKERSKQFR